MMPTNHINGQHAAITLRVKWHTYVGSNQQFSSKISDMPNKRKTMPDTRNLVNHLRLVKSWILEKKL